MGKKIVNEHDMYALGRGSARNLEKSAKLAREMGISGIQEPDKVAKMKNHDRMAHNANKLQHKLMGLDPEKNFGHLTHPDFGAGFNDFQKEHAASARPTSNMAVENKIVNKRVIRLTESDLHRIVEESVGRMLKENEFDAAQQKAEKIGEFIGYDEAYRHLIALIANTDGAQKVMEYASKLEQMYYANGIV